jgi:transcriptional regulator with XRE-family HTH domain
MADSIGRRIKFAREVKRISQGELARQTNISKGTISVLERDPAPNITIQHLIAICKSLQVSTEYILFGKDSLEHNDEWKHLANTKEGIGLRQIVLNLHKQKILEEIILSIGNLSKRDLDIVFNLIKSINLSK